jgi:carbonic anhydrase
MTLSSRLALCGLLLGQALMAQQPSPPQQPQPQQRPQPHPRPAAHYYFSKTPEAHAPKWSYSGDTGPKFWGKLDPAYRLADEGQEQSPINIDSRQALSSNLPELKFEYRREQIGLLNNGHTILHEGSPNSFMYVGEHRYSLEQFHLHSPSEHSLDDQFFDLEIHFVHKAESGDVAVVAVLMQAAENSVLDLPLISNLPQQPGQGVEIEGTRNPTDFLPRSREYFMYPGSFTTPPCTEHVLWIVMKQPIDCPPEYIERFRAILHSNNRPLQKLNARVVKKSPPGQE